MKLKVFFAWFDMWIGVYWSKGSKTLYICLLPMVVIAVSKIIKCFNEDCHYCDDSYPHNCDGKEDNESILICSGYTKRGNHD